MKNFTSVSFVMAALLLMVACGPTTYVQTVPAQQGYVDPYYDPYATIVIVGGSRGYYGANHIFYPVTVVGGAEGYYNSNHQFVSSSPVVQQAVQNKKPLYSGPSTSGIAPQTSGNTNVTPTGTIGRGPASGMPQTPQAQTVNTKPNYGSQPGTISRGPASASPAAKLNYGSSVGTISRSAPSAPSRPSFGSSGGSISRSSGSRR